MWKSRVVVGAHYDYSTPMNRLADKFEPLPKLPSPTAPDPEYSHMRPTSISWKYPKTYTLVTSSDLGGMTHPLNKSAYGARAVQVALAVAYWKGQASFSGRNARRLPSTGDKVTLKFTHVGQGLDFKNGDKLQGFIIAGADKKFVWADATIVGDTVVVSSPTVPQPAAVRYAWSDRFTWANLFNQDGLPSQPFRTDDW